ncbi:MAG: LysR family transcriptional regulator [Burkholderiales bacterium]|jgi:DNA-binding transcriptional LysR family regulator|nr:LysR family transcriptional regulator [Burkholderiales bacterium]
MDYLSAIKVFATVAETGSIRKSAKQLCKTEAAISKKIKKLEQYLGVSLISRDGKNMSITPLGSKYLLACNDLLTTFDNVQQIIKNEQAQKNKILRVGCDQFLFQQYILPKIVDFNKSYPKADLIVSNNKDYKQIKKFDLLIDVDINDEHVETLVRKKIGSTSLVICVSPNYIKQYPNKLLKHLSTMSYIQDTSLTGFSLLEKKYKLAKPQLLFDNPNAALIAAINNLGFTIAYDYMVKQYIESGSLIELVRSDIAMPLYIYYNKNSNSYLLIQQMLKLLQLNVHK